LTTINDVARRANVSPVTVSRVLNDAPNVNPGTRERVEQAIAELGYVPNVVARSLRSRRTRTIALIVPDITNTFWTTVARGVEDVAQAQGYTVFLGNSDENAGKQARYLETLAAQRADGVLIAPCDSDASRLALLRERAIPTVVLDRRVDGWAVDTVLGDSFSGAHALTRHLLRLKHRQIAMIAGTPETSVSHDRLAGYRRALDEADICFDPALVRFGDFKQGTAEILTQQMLSEGRPLTAFFAANNAIALGVIAALRERGSRVPQDVALVAFDDVANATQVFPFLTVAAQPAYEMGAQAAGLLLERIRPGAQAAPPRVVVLPCTLVVRYSCGSHLSDTDPGVSLPLPDRLVETRELIPTLPDGPVQL
jgi:LacI family transcriptional regulator